MKKFFPLLFISFIVFGCTAQQIQKTMDAVLGTTGTPTQTEAAGGLQDALVQGIITGTGLLSQENGFFGNELVKIPWPSEADKVKNTLIKMGMQNQVDKVTLSLNRAAEKASGVAVDVFIQAIKQMTFQDAMNILLGGDGSATAYLRKTTTPILTEKFRPIVDQSLGQVNATKYWTEATTIYNQVPFVKPVNTDLTAYVTERALEGVFKMVEKEENRIRQDPIARGTELMKKVFGYADTKK